MPVTNIAKLFGSDAAVRGCPCGAKRGDSKGAPSMSVVLQLATIGDKRRLRARAITIHVCDRCARLIRTKHGRKLRFALADALIAQAVDLARQKRGSDAA